MHHATITEGWTILPPFLQLIGVRDLRVDAGTAEASLIFDPSRHANGIGVAHGGVICTLLDVVMGYAAFSYGDCPGPIVTIEQSVQFTGALDSAVRAHGRVARAGRSLVFCSADIRNVAGELVASGIGTFKKVDRVLEQYSVSASTGSATQHG
ncbi:TPA: PaaI family thioesterase [Pseudomonas aeruginosa]